MIAAGELPTELTAPVASAIIGFGSLVIIVGCVSAVVTRQNTGRVLATYISVGLEFFLAAGLIRLASADTFTALGVAGLVILTRRAIVLGLGLAVRATAKPVGSHVRAASPRS